MIWRTSLVVLTLFLLSGCGVKGDPTPYLNTQNRAPSAEVPTPDPAAAPHVQEPEISAP